MGDNIEARLNPNCPCRRLKCKNHGDCAACQTRHEGKSEPPACKRLSREEKRAERKKMRGKAV